MGQILMKKVTIDDKWKKIIFFGFSQENMEKCRKKWKMMKKGQILMKKVKIDEKWKNNIFWIFSGKYGKTSKKVKNVKKGSDIDEKGQNWCKRKKIIFVGFFRKMMKRGQILMKKVKIDVKWKK